MAGGVGVADGVPAEVGVAVATLVAVAVAVAVGVTVTVAVRVGVTVAVEEPVMPLIARDELLQHQPGTRLRTGLVAPVQFFPAGYY